MFNSMLRQSKKAIALTTVFSVMSSLPALAAVKPPDAPGAGQAIGTLRDNKVVVPGKTAPNVGGIQDKTVLQKAQGPKMHVNGIHITGQDIYREDALLSLVKDGVGKDLTLPELNNLADRLTKYFHDQGYLAATVYIPEQRNPNGVVEIKVIVGKYGEINVVNKTAISKKTVNEFLSTLKKGQYVKKDSLERALLILNDISGISVQATLAPGSGLGTTDLTVALKPTQRLTTTVSFDNYGDSYTGEGRSNVSVVIHNPSNIGDELAISGVDAGSNLNTINASYQIPLGAQGGQLGAEASHTHYYLGGTFKDLKASGLATVSTAYYTKPIVRSRDYNLYGRISYDHKILKDTIGTLTDADGSGEVYKNYRINNVYHLGVVGNKRDAQGNGVTSFGLTESIGNLSINTPSIFAYDAYYAKTSGHFYKTNLNVQRQRYINKRLSYNMSLNAQYGSKNLDSSEKIFLGGANGVRAYSNGEAEGDTGVVFTNELRFDLPNPTLQLAAFIDTGRVTINQNAYDSSPNKTVLTGAGLGLIWSEPNNFSVRVDCAWRLSDPLYGDKAQNGRIWVQGIQHF